MVCTLLQTFAALATRLEDKDTAKPSMGEVNAERKELVATIVDLLESLSDLLVYRVIWPNFELGNWNKTIRGVISCLR